MCPHTQTPQQCFVTYQVSKKEPQFVPYGPYHQKHLSHKNNILWSMTILVAGFATTSRQPTKISYSIRGCWTTKPRTKRITRHQITLVFLLTLNGCIWSQANSDAEAEADFCYFFQVVSLQTLSGMNLECPRYFPVLYSSSNSTRNHTQKTTKS